MAISNYFLSLTSKNSCGFSFCYIPANLTIKPRNYLYLQSVKRNIFFDYSVL